MGNRNLSVGLFVIAALLIGAVLTVWFTGQRGSVALDRYHVMIESDVSGLTLGGPVFFLGVQVGDVADLAIVPGNPARVRVEIRVLSETPIDTGTWATLAAQGITGVSVINLYSEPGAHEPLAAIEGGPLPVIPYRDSGFSALLSSAPEVLEKLDQLLANANSLLGEENQRSVAEVLANIERLTGALTAQEARLNALPGTLDDTLREIQALVRQVDQLVVDAGPQATATLANLEAATADVQHITTRLDSWLLRHDADMQTFTADGLGQVPALVGDTRDAIRELEKLLESLRHEPSKALFQPPSNAIVVED